MRNKGEWSDTTYKSRVTEVTERGGGRATFEGEERARQGKALDPLVDPSKYTDQNKRGSNTLLLPEGDVFVAPFGIAMPVQSDPDTTGSMGGNVDVAFKVLPKVQNLLIQGEGAVLKRYHTQIATGIIQDRVDRYPYLRTMFEPDNEVERQMGLLVPDRNGGDAIEDYQNSLFMAAYLSKLSINDYGLKGYYFVIGDQIGRDDFDRRVLEQVFGNDVLERAFGSNIPKSLPSTADVAKEVVKKWHAFYLQVGNSDFTANWWDKLFGKDHIIRLPRTEDIAEIQAVIIGLTEGVLDVNTATDFIAKSGMDPNGANRIVNAVRGIPIGLQASYPNFNKIPLAGARFKSRDDIWPIGEKGSKKSRPTSEVSGDKKGKSDVDKKKWKL